MLDSRAAAAAALALGNETGQLLQPVLPPGQWHAAFLSRFRAKTIPKAEDVVILQPQVPESMSGVAAVDCSSLNLNASLVESSTVLEAEQRLQAPVIGTVPSAMRVADELHRMDVMVASSPMPCARFVFDPLASRPVHLLLNKAMQDLTEHDANMLRSVAGELMSDFVHKDDKTDLNRAFFQSVAKRRSHAFTNLRLRTAPDEDGNDVFINRTEHQFLQFYPNGRLAAVTIIEDTEPLRGLLARSMQLPPRQLAAQQANALAALLGPTSASLSDAVLNSGRRGSAAAPSRGDLADHVRRLVRRMAPTDKLAQWMLQYVFDTTHAAPSLTGSSDSSGSATPRQPLPPGLRYLPAPAAAATGRSAPQAKTSTSQHSLQHGDTLSSGQAAGAALPHGASPLVSADASRWGGWHAAAASATQLSPTSGFPPRGHTPSTSTVDRTVSWESSGDGDDCGSTGAVRDDVPVFGAAPGTLSPQNRHGAQARQFPEMTATLWHTLTPFQQVLAHTWGESMRSSSAHAPAPAPPQAPGAGSAMPPDTK